MKPNVGTSANAATRKTPNSIQTLLACSLLRPSTSNNVPNGPPSTRTAPTSAKIAMNGVAESHFAPSRTCVAAGATSASPTPKRQHHGGHHAEHLQRRLTHPIDFLVHRRQGRQQCAIDRRPHFGRDELADVGARPYTHRTAWSSRAGRRPARRSCGSQTGRCRRSAAIC